jgi:tripeptide aminopeptidase
MRTIQQISQDPRVNSALSSFVERQPELEDLIVAIQQIPSPTFAEKDRAEFVEARFAELGLQDITQDSIHDVFGRLPGKSPTPAGPVILSAHSDTVFPLHTDLSIRREDGYLYGPGIGDNATGVAGLLFLAQTLKRFDIQPEEDLWFVSNVGEEGMGDLRGMRSVVQRFGSQAIYIVVEGGSYGQIMHKAIGVSRFRIEIETPGGHSWGSFGQPSAVHEMGHLISALDEMRVPSKPRTTYNVGVVEGGTTINSIAASASLLLDIRSAEASELERLVNRVKDIVAGRLAEAKRSGKEIMYRVEQVGDRPAGRIPRKDPLVQWAEGALQYVGHSPVTFIAGSTDCNIPLSRGLRSVCIGLTCSGNSHRQDEFIELEYLPAGMQQMLLLSMAAARF